MNFQPALSGVELLKSRALFKGQWGIEREALRIDQNGQLSRSPHPAALAEPEFARDFAEAQLEIITPPLSDPDEVFSALREQTRKAYAALDNRSDGKRELLWPFSMPVPIDNPESVEPGYKDDPVAFMYRKGLAARYGVRAQLVSGIHYNFSFSTNLLFDASVVSVDDLYFHVIRNLYRNAWALILLFGASPRRFEPVAGSKIKSSGRRDAKGKPFSAMDETGACKSYLHSLRTGPSGYSALNSELPEMHYGSLAEYRAFVQKAVSTPSSRFQGLVSGKDQLNGNIAQKESEVYLPFRYRNSASGPYLEIRLFDVDPYLPWGIDGKGIRLIHLFIVKALLDVSPLFTEGEWITAGKRMKQVSLCARALRFADPLAAGKKLAALFADFDHILDEFHPDDAASYRESVSWYRTRVQKGDYISERIEREIGTAKGDAVSFGLRRAELNKEEVLHG